jgi:hypothetical protein
LAHTKAWDSPFAVVLVPTTRPWSLIAWATLVVPPRGAEVPHPALLPEEGVLRAEPGGDAVPDDLAAVVDGAGLTDGVLATQRAQIDDLPLAGIRCGRCGGRRCRDCQ